ncbi:MAG: CotH kinase family protein, partial [Planctomycetales bacterium]
RYLACCSAMVNLDSFLGFNHNYFLYLNPEDERFVMIPWDLNGSFAGMTMSGSPERQANWSIATPYIWHNRLVERLLVIPAYDALYRQRLRELLDQAFQADRLSASIDAMQALIEPVVARERAASKPELPAGLALLIALGGQPTELKPFIEQRSRSVRRQLEGEIRGNELILGLGMPTERDTLAKQLARPLLKAVDQNQDGQLSVDEIAAGLAELERRSTAPAAEGTPVLNEEALAKQIANIFPKRSGMFQWLGGGRAPSRAGFGPGPLLAGYLLYGLGHDVYAQPREHLAELAPALLVRADANEDQLVDQRELARLLNWLPPVPQHFGVDVQAAQPEKSTGRTPASE